MSKRRHFLGRELGEDGREQEEEADRAVEEDADEKAARADRRSTLQALKNEDKTLGAWLAEFGPHERKSGVHAHRSVVRAEFEKLWVAQAEHHPGALTDGLKQGLEDAIFFQRPVFWRKNTLGECRFMPGEALCPKGAWLSQQRRMLEKLNNLAVAGGNARPLDADERAAILGRLQIQATMSWGGVRDALKPLFKARGEPGGQRRLKFNLELGGERLLLGNALEARLAAIFGEVWAVHPHKAEIRDAVHRELWAADYGEIGNQRVVILRAEDRKVRRAEAVRRFVDAYGIGAAQAAKLEVLSLPTGWEPYSVTALRAFMPHLEAGTPFGALVNGPDWEAWRAETFPARDQPTGEILDRLPSPADREESERLAALRNPTVVRAQNELRKVVNNLISVHGKPDVIRIELTREVGSSKRQRDERKNGIRKHELRRKAAARDLESKGIAEPSHDAVEKWLLWQECGERCPYTGDHIGFDALFRENLFEVEHIWPRSRSFDDSFGNKTLCRRDINLAKGNRTPFEYLGHQEEEWAAVRSRPEAMSAARGKAGMSRGKVRKFLADSMPDDFANRQMTDTGYAARQAVGLLKRLWPDVGPEAPVNVQAVTGRVTAQLRRLWGLNNILAVDGEKTRADHRHHAIDALTVACAHPGMTQRLSNYWRQREDPGATKPELAPPWPTIRADAESAMDSIIVSHRVRKKVSGPLHKETVYGDAGADFTTQSGTYRQYVTRKPVGSLSKSELASDPETDGEGIRDSVVRRVLREWVETHGGDPKKAFPPYPTLGENGPEICKVRLLVKQQSRLMAPLATGSADLGANHHIAIYRQPDGRIAFDVVSLFEAARRLSRREPVVCGARDDGAEFVMSLAAGEALHIPRGKLSGLWIVTGVWANGQIVVEQANDATHQTTTCSAPGSLDTSLSHAAGLIEIAACHA